MTLGKLRNWAGNYGYKAAYVKRPETVEQLQEMVRGADHVRALGTRHSFNAIADTPGDLISTENLNRLLELDAGRRTVTVEGGITYGRLAEQLQCEGFALHNLASLPHISVAGACATATHGSGDQNGNLATAVSAMEIILADGSTMKLRRGDAAFSGAVVNLGCLGVVARLTLDIEPTYEVRQVVYERLALAELEEHFDQITSSAYSVSLFNDWQTDAINQLWVKERVGTSEGARPHVSALAVAGEGARPPRFGVPASANRHPLEVNSSENCTQQMGVPGPWHERLPHFRMEFTPSNGEELQSEYLVPRRHAVTAIRSIYELRNQLAPLLFISEIRTIAADELWMSPCYRQACVGIHFTWQQNWAEVSKLLPQIEALLKPFGARPHWGKLFTMPASEIRRHYPRLRDFVRLVNRCDPKGKFGNAFVDDILG